MLLNQFAGLAIKKFRPQGTGIYPKMVLVHLCRFTVISGCSVGVALLCVVPGNINVVEPHIGKIHESVYKPFDYLKHGAILLSFLRCCFN
jgi:hypothetical protein